MEMGSRGRQTGVKGQKVPQLSPLCVKGRSNTPEGDYSFELPLG